MQGSNEEFIKKAFESGLTENQVRMAVAERNGKKTQSKGTDTIGVIKNIVDAFTGRTQDFGKTLLSAAEGYGSNQLIKGSESAQKWGQIVGSKNNKGINDFASKLADLASNLNQKSNDIRQEQGTMGSIDQGIVPALKTGGQVMDRAAGAFGEIAPWLIPGGQLGKANALQRIGSAGITGLEGGAIRGVTTPGKDLINRLILGGEEASVGTIAGLATQGVIEGGRAVINGLGNAGTKLWASTLKNTDKADRIIKKYGGVDGFVQRADDLNIPNSKDKVIRELNNMGESWGKDVNDLIANSNGKIDTDQIFMKAIQDLEPLNNPIQQAKYKAGVKWLESVYGKYGELSMGDAYNMRKLLDSEGARNFLDQSADKGMKIAMSNVATELNQEILKNVPEVAPTFAKYGLLKDAISIFYKEPAFGLTNMVGTAVGAPFGVPAAAGTTMASFLLKSPAIKRIIGTSLSKLPEVAPVTANRAPAFMAPLYRYFENQQQGK